jgi:gentisate 1,2-dioxygenase
MTEGTARFIDRTGTDAAPIALWPALVVPRAAIEAEIERLTALPAPANGRRSALIVHPRAREPGLGLAPGIRVSLNVLRPGERTRPIRHNSTQVEFCIRGGGRVMVGPQTIDFDRYDVWNTPSMAPYAVQNDRDELQVRLTYSNAALLEMMNVHVMEEEAVLAEMGPDRGAGPLLSPAPFAEPLTGEEGALRLTDDAYLMTYEQLINPRPVQSRPLHWPWKLVKARLDELVALGDEYRGRRLYLLFNPATGRTNGTTHSFFATITIRPPRIVDRPHRHTSAAINYYFAGRGHSTVEGERFEWRAGDLMFSAPGWGVHNHASHDEPVYELTIQDSPLNIAMESLLWQEDLKGPVAVLGSQTGFRTNRAA